MLFTLGARKKPARLSVSAYSNELSPTETVVKVFSPSRSNKSGAYDTETLIYINEQTISEREVVSLRTILKGLTAPYTRASHAAAGTSPETILKR